MEEQKRILKDVFGESSESEDEEQQLLVESINGDPSQRPTTKNPNWEQIKEINGLWLCRDFLSSNRQSSLLSAIENEGWFTEASHNQAMRFGDLPAWATELSQCIREAVCFSVYVPECADLAVCHGDTNEACPLPSDLLWREPLFDQLIVNAYQPGNMWSCGPHALRGWDCHHFPRIHVCNALHTS